MKNLPIPNFVTVEEQEGLHGSIKDKVHFILTDDKGQEWHIGVYDLNKASNPLIEYRRYPYEYKKVAGTRGTIPLFTEINKRMIEAIKAKKYEEAGLSPEQARTAVRI
jgi:hypothetical protein